MTNGLNDTSHKSRLIIANMFDYSSQMIAFAKVTRIPPWARNKMAAVLGQGVEKRGLRDLPI